MPPMLLGLSHIQYYTLPYGAAKQAVGTRNVGYRVRDLARSKGGATLLSVFRTHEVIHVIIHGKNADVIVPIKVYVSQWVQHGKRSIAVDIAAVQVEDGRVFEFQPSQ